MTYLCLQSQKLSGEEVLHFVVVAEVAAEQPSTHGVGYPAKVLDLVCL